MNSNSHDPNSFRGQLEEVPTAQKVLLIVLILMGIYVGYFFLFVAPNETNLTT